MFKHLKKTIAKRFADATGNDLIPKAKYQHPRRLLQTAIEHYEIDLIIDVGANKGQFAGDMIKTGFKGTILSFEPTPSTFQILEKKAAGNPNWQCIKMGLGDQPAQLSIHSHDDSSLNSFLDTNELAHSRYEGLERDKELVDVERLDTIIEKMIDEKILPKDFRAFLKIDTQGYDLKVIDGASRILDQISIIQTEASVNPIYDGMPNYIESVAKLDSLGFKPAAFVTVSRDFDSLQFIEFDLISIKPAKKSVVE
ncbi:hypothetical protein ASF69_03225 [Rhizobium sp. Leaf311]|uniref:FkbM family methyltransferase n=1 Tax=Rhizobium sp. Leaf311 TaxID=1736332 RepID=UPI000715B2C5|nr:FkbM family methyltransferase [Rhizobium sp. Leaf311]KQQ61418.1 hypothetical protein ASF69_03225 [Rhizobium sp. Leaf311]